MSAAWFLLAAVVAAPTRPAPTQDTAQRLSRVHDRRASLTREIEALRGQEKSLLGDVERLDLEVNLRSEELREIQLTLRRTREEIDAAERRAGSLEKSLAATRPAVMARARALYKLGQFSYVRLLLSVDRPVDVLRAYRFVSTLAREDRGRVARFRRDLGALALTQADLQKKRQQTLDLRAEVERRRRRLDEQRKNKTALLTSIVERKEVHLAYAEELSAAETKLQQLLAGTAPADVALPISPLRGSLPWPVAGRVRSGFGPHKHPKFETVTVQNGIEIDAGSESGVAAVHEGVVAFAGRFRGYGLMAVVDHGGKYHSLYARLAELRVAKDERVTAGQTLGVLLAEDPAPFYFELRAQGRPVDPEDWLSTPER
jgi:murein hydrolase activator